MAHKFYVAEFIPTKYKMRDPNDVLVKFGITKNMDVLERFNPYYDKRYNDFIIKVKFSKAVPNMKIAEDMERHWLEERFPNPGPNKVWIENYLQCDKNNEYDDTGITEIRLLKRYQLGQILTELYNSLTTKDKELKLEARKQYV